jgi:hypothetical protein
LVGGPFLLKASNWTPAFAGETNIRKAWFLVVIPAEAGIQDDKIKIKSSLDNFGLISKRKIPKGLRVGDYESS